MASIARKHFQKTLATKQAAVTKGAAAIPANVGIAAKMKAMMAGHKTILKAIKSKIEKANVKVELLPEYAAYVEGVMASGSGDQDDILVTVMLWRLDAGDYAGALEVAAYALDHGMSMPESFKSDIPTTILDVIADNNPTVEQLPYLLEAIELTKGFDMPDEVRAKAHKAAGKLLSDTDPFAALPHLNMANEFNPNSGVKTLIGKLEKQIAESGNASASD